MKNKKIFCFVLPSFFYENKGGAELQCYYLAQELLKRGWEVHYIRELEDQRYQKCEQTDGITIHAISKRRKQLRWLNKRSLLEIMRSIKADYWYSRATISYVKPLLSAAEKVGGQVIWACSSDSELCSPKKSTSFSLLGLLDKYNYRSFRKSLPHVDFIVLQTKYQQKLLRDNFALSGEVIYNSHPKPACSTVDRRNQLLWIGRLQTSKRPELFVQLAEKFQSSPYRFIAIGRPMKNSLEELLVSNQKKLSNFEFLGELDNDGVCDQLSESKLLVCTSEFEGFSNTFVEAWARGVPVVSFVVDPDGVIQKHKLGCISNSIEQMYSDVKSFMENSCLWAETSKRCLKYFEENLGISNAVDKLETVIGCRRP